MLKWQQGVACQPRRLFETTAHVDTILRGAVDATAGI